MSDRVINAGGFIVVEPVSVGKNVKYQYARLAVKLPDEWELALQWDGCHGMPIAYIDNGVLKIKIKRDKIHAQA